MGPGLRQRLSAVVEVIVPVVATQTTVPKTVNQTVNLGNGKTTTRPVHTTETVTIRKFAFSDPKYGTIRRARTPRPLPDIDYTDSLDPWGRLVQEYDAARQ